MGENSRKSAKFIFVALGGKISQRPVAVVPPHFIYNCSAEHDSHKGQVQGVDKGDARSQVEYARSTFRNRCVS